VTAPRDPLTEGVGRRLEPIVRLLGDLVTREMSRKDAILALSRMGMTPAEVAGVLGVSSNQVSVTLHGARKSAAKKRKAKGT